MNICCCVGQPVYGTTSLLHLQKRSLTAEIVGFFTAIQKAPAASNFILPKSKITDAVSCCGFNIARPSFSLPYVIVVPIASLVGVSMHISKRTSKPAKNSYGRM